MPIDVASGSVFTAAHDLEIWPATVPLVFRRTYSTARLSHPSSMFGRGWTHRFHARLTRDLEGFRFFGHDGAEVVFNTTDQELSRGGGALNLNDYMELRREGERYAVWHWHGWQGPLEKFMFEASDADVMLLSAIELPSGHALVLGYDSAGRLRRVEQKIERRVALLDYNHAGLLDRLSLAWIGAPAHEPMVVARFSYDDRLQLSATTDVNGDAISYRYDEEGRLVSETSRSGWHVAMEYDAEGRCVVLGSPDGFQRRAFQYLLVERQTIVTDSLGYVTRYHHDEDGRVQQIVHPDKSITTKQFDEFGRTIQVVGPGAPGGRQIGYVYDDRGDLVEVDYGAGLKRGLAYNDSHQVTAIHDITGAVWRIEYSNGAMAAVLDPLGQQTSYVHDRQNVLSEIHTPWGNRIRLVHDALWTNERQEDAYGLVLWYDYDIRLNITRVANAETEIARFEYDSLGRLSARVTPDGARRTFRWTKSRRLAEYVSANGGVTRTEWSPHGLPLERTDPNSLVHSCEFDSEGRIVAVVNPKGERGEFVWDWRGRALRQTFFDGRTESWQYDQNGMSAVVRADGTRLDVRCNSLGKVEEVSLNGEVLLKYLYNQAGQFVGGTTRYGSVEFAHDLRGRIVREVQHGREITYTYAAHDGVTERAFDGGRVGRVHFEYDLRGRLTTIGDSHGPLQQFEYDGRDLVSRRTFAGVTERLEYNYDGRPVHQVLSGREFTTITRSYEYDLDRNLTAIAGTAAQSSRFRYDPGERLIYTEGPGDVAESLRYDSTGNLIRRGRLDLVYERGDRLHRIGNTEFERDANGNLLHERRDGQRICFKWDALGQLQGVQHSDGRVTSYGYDLLGRRLFKEHEGRRTEFYWSGDDLLCEQTPDCVIEYAADRFWPHVIWYDGAPRHVVLSANGRVHELVDDAGRIAWRGAYDWLGSLVESSGRSPAPPFRLAGQYWDAETGLHYNRHRYYDPRSMSFISPDPIGFDGGPNAFLYAPNPVTYEDPLGLKCNIPAGKQAVYVLTKGDPPQVVYVGITDDPHSRVSGHKSADKDFDNMRVIAVVNDSRDARNIEGNLLHHIGKEKISQVAGMPIHPDGLQNKERPSSGGYYHSYVPDPDNPGKSTRGHPTMTPAQLDKKTSDTREAVPRPA